MYFAVIKFFGQSFIFWYFFGELFWTLLRDLTDRLDHKLDTFAKEMAPWGKRIFIDTPEWVKTNLVIERARIGAANKKALEWLEELNVSV